MPEFFTVLTPDAARTKWFDALPAGAKKVETIATHDALDRVLAVTTHSAEALPAFRRSTVDGYAVRGADTHGASDSLPVYLHMVGEVPMGQMPAVEVGSAQAALVHTGGAVPDGADAVVMVENTQAAGPNEIEVVRSVAAGENVLQVGEDIQPGDQILPAGHTLRPQDIGGLLALGIVQVQVAAKPVVAIIATGDEIIPPDATLMPGQIRDINSYTIGSQTRHAGGEPLLAGIVPDKAGALREAVAEALDQADAVVLSAGSSVSVRDLTATVFNDLGKPGVLVHGVAVKPGKPTILGVIDDKPVMGLPGNPVSAMVSYQLFGVPLVRLLLATTEPVRRVVPARLAVNVASTAGREDYVAVQMRPAKDGGLPWAEPIFGKSNLIYTLVHAGGLVKVPLDATGLYAESPVEVQLF